MERAKDAVTSFLSREGKHDTTVQETVNPAIQKEHVRPTEHEDVQTVVDREVHQHHHHTSVQPITDREVLPEVHDHRVAGVEHRHVKHGNDSHIQDRVAAEQAEFQNTRTVDSTHHTTSTAPIVSGEHHHHHIHETIQPVIHKETVQPHVTHTTIPVHEVHENEAKHHAATALPTVSMEEFRRAGGSLGGRGERTDAFTGEPKDLSGGGPRGSLSLNESDPRRDSHGSAQAMGVGPAATGAHDANGLHDTNGLKGSNGVQKTSDTRAPMSSTHTNGASKGATNGAPTAHKPSFMDKINPRKDADGDGVRGFMK